MKNFGFLDIIEGFIDPKLLIEQNRTWNWIPSSIFAELIEKI
jgi:hypothetical protein